MPTLLEERQEFEKKAKEYEKERLEKNAEYYAKNKQEIENTKSKVEKALNVSFSNQLKGKVIGFLGKMEPITLDNLEINDNANYIGTIIEPTRLDHCLKQSVEFYDSIFEGASNLDEKDFTIEKNGERVSVYSLVRSELEKTDTTNSITAQDVRNYTKAYIVHFLACPEVKLCYNPAPEIEVPCYNIALTQARRGKRERFNKALGREMKALTAALEKEMPEELKGLFFDAKKSGKKDLTVLDLSQNDLKEAEKAFDKLFSVRDKECRHFLGDFKITQMDGEGLEEVFSVPEVVAHELRESNKKLYGKEFEQMCKAQILLAAVTKKPEIHYNMDKWVVENDVVSLNKKYLEKGFSIGGESGIETRIARSSNEIERKIKMIPLNDFKEEMEQMGFGTRQMRDDIYDGIDLEVLKKAEELFDRIYEGPMKADKNFLKNLNIMSGTEAYTLYDGLVYDDFQPYSSMKDKKGIKNMEVALKKICILYALIRDEKVKYREIEIPTFITSATVRDQEYENMLSMKLLRVNTSSMHQLPMNTRKHYRQEIQPESFSEEDLDAVEKYFDEIFEDIIETLKPSNKDIFSCFSYNWKGNGQVSFRTLPSFVDEYCSKKEEKSGVKFTPEQKRKFEKMFLLHFMFNPEVTVQFTIPSIIGDKDGRTCEMKQPEIPEEYIVGRRAVNTGNWLDSLLPLHDHEILETGVKNGYNDEVIELMMKLWDNMTQIKAYCYVIGEEKGKNPGDIYNSLLEPPSIDEDGNVVGNTMDCMQRATEYLQRFFKTKIDPKDEKAQQAFVDELYDFMMDFDKFYCDIPQINRFHEPSKDLEQLKEEARIEREKREREIERDGREKLITRYRGWNKEHSFLSEFGKDKLLKGFSKEEKSNLLVSIYGNKAAEVDELLNAMPNFFVAYCIGEKEIDPEEMRGLSETDVQKLVKDFYNDVITHPTNENTSSLQYAESLAWYGKMFGKAIDKLSKYPFQTDLNTISNIYSACESGKLFNYYVSLSSILCIPARWKININYTHAMSEYLDPYRLERASEVDFSYQRAILSATDEKQAIDVRALNKLILELEYEPLLKGKSFEDLKSKNEEFAEVLNISEYFNLLDTYVLSSNLNELSEDECRKILNTPMEELKKTDTKLYDKTISLLKKKFPVAMLIKKTTLTTEVKLEETHKEGEKNAAPKPEEKKVEEKPEEKPEEKLEEKEHEEKKEEVPQTEEDKVEEKQPEENKVEEKQPEENKLEEEKKDEVPKPEDSKLDDVKEEEKKEEIPQNEENKLDDVKEEEKKEEIPQNEENKLDDVKEEEKKEEIPHTEENKVEEIKPEEKQVEEIKPEEKQVEEIKPEEKQVEEIKPEEKQVEEIKPEEKQVEEIKPEEKQVEEIKPKEKQVEEIKPEEKQVEEIKPEEKQVEEVKPEEKQTEENKTEENKTEENKIEGNKSGDNKSDDNKSEEYYIEEEWIDEIPEVGDDILERISKGDFEFKSKTVEKSKSVLQTGKDWENYQEASKNMAAFRLWKGAQGIQLEKLETALKNTKIKPAEGSPAEKMMDSIVKVRGLLENTEGVSRKELNSALMELFNNADQFRQKFRKYVKPGTSGEKNIWYQKAKECMNFAKYSKMSLETMLAWVKDVPLKTEDGKSFKNATLDEITKTLEKKASYYEDDTNYARLPEVIQMTLDVNEAAEKQLALIIRMGKDSGRNFDFNAFSGEPDSYMIPKKDPSVKDLAKEYYIKNNCANIVSKRFVQNRNLLNSVERDYLSHFQNDVENLRKDPVFKGFCKNHPKDIYAAWADVCDTSQTMRYSFYEYVSEAEEMGYASYVMSNVYDEEKVGAVTLHTLVEPEIAYSKLASVVLGQIFMQPENEKYLRGVITGQYDMDAIRDKTMEYLKKKKLIPEKELTPSRHTERKDLEKAIESGKLRDDVFRKIVLKQKVAEIKKPVTKGMTL